MIPKRQAVSGLTAVSSNMTKPVHCTGCGKLVRVARGPQHAVALAKCGACLRK
jgi:hypothetical protein